MIAPYYCALVGVSQVLPRLKKGIGVHRGGPFALVAAAPLYGVIGALLVAPLLATLLTRPNGHAVVWFAQSGHGTVMLVQTPVGGALLVDGGDSPAALQEVVGEHVPFMQRALSAVVVTEPNQAQLAGLVGLTGLYHIDRAYDPGAIYPSIAYAGWRAELRRAGVPESIAGAATALDLGAVHMRALLPNALTADQAPAPSAYLVRAERLAVLIVNREAAAVPAISLASDASTHWYCRSALSLTRRKR